MRTVLAAVLLVACTTAVGAPMPQSQPQGKGVEGWPPVGTWAVLLLPISNGRFICTATTREPPWGPAGYSIAFVLSMTNTHLYLSDTASTASAPRELVLAVDDRIVAHLRVLAHGPAEGDGKGMIVADLPGDMFVRQVVPAMLHGRTLTVAAEQDSHSVPIENFRAVMQEISDCARIAVGLAQGPA